MTTATEHFDLEYLDPSQSQPEVKINANLDKIDLALFEAGGAIIVKQVGDSPAGNALHVRELRFVGATVDPQTDGVAVVTISAESDSGAGSLDVSDGTTTVHNVRNILFTGGATVTAATDATAVVAAGSSGGGAGSGARATLTSNQTIPTATDTQINFDATEFDEGGFVTSSPATSFTAPAAGIFGVAASVLWDSATSGSRSIYFVVNGDASTKYGGADSPATLAAVQLSIACLLNLAEGDTVEVWATHDDGSSIDIVASTQKTTFAIWAVEASGGGGGGSGDLNVAPENHLASPNALNDEFEGAAGDPLDGSWTWVNQTTTTASQTGDGSIIVAEPGTGAGAGFSGFFKNAPATPWTIQGRIAGNVQITGQHNAFFGVCVYNSSTGVFYVVGPMNSGGGIGAHPVLLFTGGFPTSSGTLEYGNTADQFAFGDQSDWAFYQIENDGTNLHFKISKTGVAGSFGTVFSVPLATSITAVDKIGFANNTGYAVQAWADHFRVF